MELVFTNLGAHVRDLLGQLSNVGWFGQGNGVELVLQFDDLLLALAD